MRGNDEKFSSTPPRGQLVFLALSLVLPLGMLLAVPAAAQEAPAADELPTAQVLKLQLPITTNVKAAFVNALNRYTTRLPADAKLPVLVIEFTLKEGEVGRGSNFSDCYAIAELLLQSK